MGLPSRDLAALTSADDIEEEVHLVKTFAAAATKGRQPATWLSARCGRRPATHTEDTMLDRAYDHVDRPQPAGA
jgi:hypothetical protein